MNIYILVINYTLLNSISKSIIILVINIYLIIIKDVNFITYKVSEIKLKIFKIKITETFIDKRLNLNKRVYIKEISSNLSVSL